MIKPPVFQYAEAFSRNLGWVADHEQEILRGKRRTEPKALTGRLGGWEVGRLGGWEVGRLAGWEVGRLGGWEVGRLGGWQVRRHDAISHG